MTDAQKEERKTYIINELTKAGSNLSEAYTRQVVSIIVDDDNWATFIDDNLCSNAANLILLVDKTIRITELQDELTDLQRE